jgi:hypothetical protein
LDTGVESGIPAAKAETMKRANKIVSTFRTDPFTFTDPFTAQWIAGQPNDTMNEALKKFLEVFWKTWAWPDPVTKKNRTLQEAVDAAKKATDSVAKGPGEHFYPIKPRIYGCKDLMFDEK